MSLPNDYKINRLFAETTPGLLLTTKWMESQGISKQLIQRYLKSGWLKRVGQGAYLKTGDQLTWVNLLASLQQQPAIEIHIGGSSALHLLGKSHYLSPDNTNGPGFIHLFTRCAQQSLPRWFFSAVPAAVFNKNKKFFYVHNLNLFDESVDKTTLFSLERGNFQLTIACPERAIMEMLALVLPKNESFQLAYDTMQNFTYARPDIIQTLLEHCHSIKVKRLFLYLAERCQHEWVKKLNLHEVTLGSGKRRIGKGGHYDPHYQISVPPLEGDTNNEIIPSV